jgi:hypothetical protein
MHAVSSRFPRQFRIAHAALATAACGLAPSPAHAHVKWFSQFDYATPPQTIPQVTTGVFWAMLALSVVVLLVLVWLDQRIAALPAADRVSRWFEGKSESSLLVMRVATFATLLVAWQVGTLFAPELVTNNMWIERLQFAIVVLLFTVPTTSLAGLGLAGVWCYGVGQYGFFHMLDYLNVLGVAYFLAVRPLTTPLLRATALPVLYATVGFSLFWVACEKLVYPEWVNDILEQNPILTLGLDRDFFRVAAAFIEMGLGFLLMIGLFGRSLSIVITLTFFLTTMVFGKTEIIGHTLIHAALIVFLFEGPGHVFRPPAYFHRTLPLRMAFAGVNFVIVTFVALAAYMYAARQVAAEATASGASPAGAHAAHLDHAMLELADGEPVPTLALAATPDPAGGWNLRFTTTNFRFAPEHAGQPHAAGEGHVHLHIDGDKAARVYGEWFHLDALPPGEHELRATLNSNDHRMLAVDGKAIEATAEIASSKP